MDQTHQRQQHSAITVYHSRCAETSELSVEGIEDLIHNDLAGRSRLKELGGLLAGRLAAWLAAWLAGRMAGRLADRVTA